MIPVYVINLLRSPDRRAFMLEQLAGAGVAGEFIAVVDGRACRARGPALLSVGERALILSHRKVWRRLLASGASFGVVLEDDAHLGGGFAALLAADWRVHAFDVVKLETVSDRVWIARRGASLAGRTLRRLGAEHLGSAGYLVSRAGAQKLIAMTQRLDAPIDQTLFGYATVFEGRLRVLQLVPAAVLQDRLLPNAREFTTTLQEADRRQISEASRRNKPQGLARFVREVTRLVAQAQRIARLWPSMRRERVPWR